MNGNNNPLLTRLNTLFGKNSKRFLAIFLVFLLYFFVVVMFKVSSTMPKPEIGPQQHSYLYLMEFISGYRTEQRDFEIKNIRFGEKFLIFTLDLKFRPRTELEVKMLAMDMVLGLSEEYPELESINIDASRDSGEGSLLTYGSAVYSGEDKSISWKFR